ncbi:MAG: peptidase [Pirellulaceae bacterium]|nr:MAG: peptidase [Pirellulaceae bacterium]
MAQSIRRIFMPIGDGTETLDTFYPYFRLAEAGYEVVVAGPEARLYHTVLHEIPPDSAVPWDITQERPGYFLRATVAFSECHAESFAGAFLSGGRAPEYLRYYEPLLQVVRALCEANKPIACICHGIEILAAAGVLEGRTVTTVAKCALDATQVGARYVNQPVVVDRNIVTARTWHDNALLMREFLKLLEAAELTATPTCHDRA